MSFIARFAAWLKAASLVEVGGWTMIHSVWELLVVGLLTVLALHILSAASARSRYLVAVASLFLMLVLPVVTFRREAAALKETTGVWLDETRLPVTLHAIAPIPDDTKKPSSVAQQNDRPTALKLTGESTGLNPFREKTKWLETILPWAFLAWMGGVFILSLWNIGGWIATQRLRSLCTSQVAPELVNRLNTLARLVGLNRPVSIARSTLVHVPVVIGFLRPIILMPASVLAGLPAAHLDAILAHELAHIRRQDYLVNLFQVVVETLFFYHPAVWWVSSRIRTERENCCDDVAVGLCGDSRMYAQALISVEGLRPPETGLALAATGGGSMFVRIQRLTRRSVPSRSPRYASGIAALLLLSLLLIPLLRDRLLADNPPPTHSVTIRVIDPSGGTVPIYAIEAVSSLQPQSHMGSWGKAAFAGLRPAPISGSVQVDSGAFDPAGIRGQLYLRFRSAATGDALVATGDVPPDPSNLTFALVTASDTEKIPSFGPIATDELAGCIIDSDGNPVSGATVSVLGSSVARSPVESGGAGNFRFPRFGGAWYVALKVEKAGYATRWIVDLPIGDWFAVRLDKTTRLMGEATLPDGSPAVGTTIVAEKTKVSTRVKMGPIDHLQVEFVVDSRGHFDIPLEPGIYELLAQRPNNEFARVSDVQLVKGKVAEQRLEVAPGIPVAIRVVDSVSGAPIARAHLSITQHLGPFFLSWAPGTERMTDETGLATWKGVMPGLEAFSVTAQGYEMWRSSADPRKRGFEIDGLVFDIHAGMPQITVELEAAMHVTGRVVYSNGHPAAAVWVNVDGLHTGDHRYAHKTDLDGKFDFTFPAGLNRSPAESLVLIVGNDSNGTILLGKTDEFMPSKGGQQDFTIRIGPEPFDPTGKPVVVFPHEDESVGAHLIPQTELPFPIGFRVSPADETDTPTGDQIIVTSVTGDRNTIEDGGTYVVQGTYVLKSADSATLSLGLNTLPAGPHSHVLPVPLSPASPVVRSGNGKFIPASTWEIGTDSNDPSVAISRGLGVFTLRGTLRSGDHALHLAISPPYGAHATVVRILEQHVRMNPTLTVGVDNRGSMTLNSVAIADDHLLASLEQSHRNNPGGTVLIVAAETTNLKRLAFVMDCCRKAGINAFSIQSR